MAAFEKSLYADAWRDLTLNILKPLYTTCLDRMRVFLVLASLHNGVACRDAKGYAFLVDMFKKLEILAGAARYDVSCASSGSRRRERRGGVGNASASGICHSWSDDGRCISLLKVLFSNACIYDCAYCANRCSNPIPRATFTVDELSQLTLHFYRRNYIEGLFLSSGVIVSPDYTMERLALVAEKLRCEHRFGGYIHLKAIPGSSPELIRRAGAAADRLSVNIELPSEVSLRRLAPQKKKDDIVKPMAYIGQSILENREERRTSKKAPLFAPAGQSTQLIVGASPEPDGHILRLSDALYSRFHLKRVYYSAYVPVNDDDPVAAQRATRSTCASIGSIRPIGSCGYMGSPWTTFCPPTRLRWIASSIRRPHGLCAISTGSQWT